LFDEPHGLSIQHLLEEGTEWNPHLLSQYFVNGSSYTFLLQLVFLEWLIKVYSVNISFVTGVSFENVYLFWRWYVFYSLS